MANEVRLTIVGDETDAVRALQAVDKAAEEAGKRFTETSASIDESSRRVGESVRRGGDESAQGLTRFVDAADLADTRAMGFRDGITGLQDSMAGLATLARGDMLQGLFLLGAGFGDLASNAANFSGPVIGGMLTRLGAARVAFLGLAGAAGIGAVLAAIKLVGTEFNKVEIDISHAAEDFERFFKTGRETVTIRQFIGALDGDLTKMRQQLELARRSWYEMLAPPRELLEEFEATPERLLIEWRNAGKLFEQLDASIAQYIEQTGDAAGATKFLTEILGAEGLQLAIQEGLLKNYHDWLQRTTERTWDQQEAEDAVAKAYDNALSSLQAYTDYLRAQTDPVFAWMDAEAKLREAIARKNELVKEGKTSGEEYEQATRDVAQAELDLFNATGRLADVNAEKLIPMLQRLRDDGYLTEDSFQLLKQAILEAQGAARAADGTRTRMYIDYYIQQHGWSPTGHGPFSGLAEGGPVTPFRPYIVGEEGPELFVSSVPGRIIPNDELTRLLAGAGNTTSTTIVNVTLNMDDIRRVRDIDEFLRMLRNNSRRGLVVAR